MKNPCLDIILSDYHEIMRDNKLKYLYAYFEKNEFYIDTSYYNEELGLINLTIRNHNGCYAFFNEVISEENLVSKLNWCMQKHQKQKMKIFENRRKRNPMTKIKSSMRDFVIS